jgi:diacylglycerol kinase family enzyme
MRVTVIHNPGAGDGETSAKELLAALREHGYQPQYHSSKGGDLGTALADPGELVVVAGGDGTVGDVAKRLAGRAIPVAVLPAGTANNIATTLGSEGPLRDQVARWAAAPRRPFDVGRARGPWGKRSFIESVGCGLVADMMARFDRKKEQEPAPADPEDEVRAAREELRQLLRGARPRHCRIEADGRDLSGRYLLVEVMNIPRIGPRLLLAPGADPGDGSLDVVALADEHTEQLDAYLRAGGSESANAAVAAHLVSRQARHVMIDPGDQRVHLDDEILLSEQQSARGGGPIHLHLQAGALQFLSAAR